MGIGMIVAGLASVIIGQAILGRKKVAIAATAVVLGSVLYRVVIQFALQVGLNPNDMKLISAVLVVIALILPQWGGFKRIAARLRRKPPSLMDVPPGGDSARVHLDDGTVR